MHAEQSQTQKIFTPAYILSEESKSAEDFLNMIALSFIRINTRWRLANLHYGPELSDRKIYSAGDEPISTMPSNYGGLLKEHHHYPWRVEAAPAEPKI